MGMEYTRDTLSVQIIYFRRAFLFKEFIKAQYLYKKKKLETDMHMGRTPW